MRTILKTEICKEKCNAAALGAYNAAVGGVKDDQSLKHLKEQSEINNLVKETVKKIPFGLFRLNPATKKF